MKNRCWPAEWTAQGGVMLTWPHEHSGWGKHLAEAEQTFCEITYHIATYEQVLINCNDGHHQDHVLGQLHRNGVNLDKIHIHLRLGDDSWARDHGPITVFEDNEPLILDFTFNGWGNKYPSTRDNALTRAMVESGCFRPGVGYYDVDFILEGGSIDSDGHGTLLTTESCLLANNRNPGFNKAEVEKLFKGLLGVDRILWLTNGLTIGDDTDGHIDTLARFCSPNTIAFMSCNRANDAHYPKLQAMAYELATFVNRAGKPYQLVPLPTPAAIHASQGERLPASYANFLIINNAVLTPTYQDPADHDANQTLQHCFPNHKIIDINCTSLIQQRGSLHCATMQLPRGVLV